MFDTPLVLRGPLRKPHQMLAGQEYGGHASIHDDQLARQLGFKAGPIEGPTHFSLFPPLLLRMWGQSWFERGCISAHYQNMVVEGEEVRAFAEVTAPGTRTRVWAEKADGTPVLEASASLGPDHGETLLEARLKTLRPPEKLVILANLKVGLMGREDERVRMDPEQNMGALYPFSLRQKLEVITETSPWYSNAAVSPWHRAVIPIEMVSVLTEYTGTRAGFPVKGPVIRLFADQEIRMIDGPLLVGEDYLIRREIVALSASKRTESYWIRSRVYDANGKRQVAETLVNHAVLKHSYANYAAESA